MLYLYALTDHPAVVPRSPGLNESEPEVEQFDSIDGVVGVIDGPIEPVEEAILAHARVVEEVAAVNDAVLPARFGRGYPDADALRRAVDGRAEDLKRALDRVRGCVELGLRVLATSEETVPSGGSGRDYMYGRLQARQSAERLADELHAPLTELARAETRSVGATPQLLLSASYLVPRDAVNEFRSAVRALGDEHQDLTLACTGPWAPYSFVTAEVAPE